MVDFPKNNDFINQETRKKWASIKIGDIKVIIKKGKKPYNFEGMVIGKNYMNISLKRIDNGRIESIIFSDLLQGEIIVTRKKDYTKIV